jgi:tetratricopeptide (TPR) repeat protein
LLWQSRPTAAHRQAALDLIQEGLTQAHASLDRRAIKEAHSAAGAYYNNDPDVASHLKHAQAVRDLDPTAFEILEAAVRVGDRALFDHVFNEGLAAAEATRRTSLLSLYGKAEAMISLANMDFATSRNLIERSFELCPTDVNLAQTYFTQLAWLAYETGDLSRARDLLAAGVERNPGILAYRAALAVILARLGRSDEAQQLLRDYLAEGVESLPHDIVYQLCLAMAVEASALLNEPHWAGELYDALAPFSGQLIVNIQCAHCHGARRKA